MSWLLNQSPGPQPPETAWRPASCHPRPRPAAPGPRAPGPGGTGPGDDLLGAWNEMKNIKKTWSLCVGIFVHYIYIYKIHIILGLERNCWREAATDRLGLETLILSESSLIARGHPKFATGSMS